MTVQSLSTTIDQFGGEVKAWSDRYIDVWCQPLPIGSSAAGGGEYNDDAQMQADTKYEFVSRYLPGVEYTDRIYWSGGYFDIYQIFPIGRREGVRIRASWSDDQGDAFAMGSLGAQQAVAGTGGLTLAEVTAQYESNDTGQTFDQLVKFYNDAKDPYQGILDTMVHNDSSVALSMRKLKGSYTGPCVKVRRTSDNTYLNVGFDSTGYLDVAALEAFCAGTDGRVHTWFDQGGDENHLMQESDAYQPIIVSNGTALNVNGKVYIKDADISGNTFSTLRSTSFSADRYSSFTAVAMTLDQNAENSGKQMLMGSDGINTGTNTYSLSGGSFMFGALSTGGYVSSDKAWTHKNGALWASYTDSTNTAVFSRSDVAADLLNTPTVVTATVFEDTLQSFKLGYGATNGWAMPAIFEVITTGNESYGAARITNGGDIYVAEIHGVMMDYYNIT